METEQEHIKKVFEKSQKTREKFNIYMLGNGMFSDFDEVKQRRRVQEKKEKNNES